MPQAGDYRITVTHKDTGAFVGVYPVKCDGTTPPESLALQRAVEDGRFNNINDAHDHAKCVIMTGPN